MSAMERNRGKYRAAVIGLGKIGLGFDVPPQPLAQSHVGAIVRCPDIELVAGVGVRQEQGDQLATLAPEAKFYLSLDEMLGGHELDIVCICTPSHVRYEVVEKVLRGSAVKLIFLEKPVATSLPEAERIIELAAQYDCQVIVNLSRRWNDSIRGIRDAVEEQRYGKLRNVHLRYTRGIYNYGSHMFDLVRFTTGSMTQVQTLRQVPTTGDAREDWCYSFLFTLDRDGASGYAEAFDDRDYVIFEMELYFERGKIELLLGGDEIRYHEAIPHPMIPGFSLLTFAYAEDRLLAKSSNMQNAFFHLTDVLQGGATPVSTLADGVYPMHVAEALLESHRGGGAVVAVKSGQ
ncbi:Gfo/Idh/MocA family protein [Paenibacillus cymbidii]|uniref:Gfo/Idh/MocA family protein n=1 Tax=Paenibacillus cymbidii TaxID=1639034 RepID=UPI001081074A|nr:Gfo/Idh/MocA family oxidoreductase [Paenibacillus cymbidii]